MDIVPWYKKRLRWLGKSYKNIDALLREIHVIPFHVARQLLAPMTWQEFIDILNIPSTDKRHLVTEAEEDFRDYEKTHPGVPFFRKREIVDSYLHEHTPERHEYMERFFNIEYDEWLRWIERNPDMLPESRLSQGPVFVTVEEARSVISKYQQMLSQYDTALSHEKAENEALKARIAKLESTAQEGGEFPESYEGHGIFTMVAKMVHARASVPEIMRAVDDEKEFLSQREAGYFFHPSPEGKKPSTLRNYQKNHVAK